MVYGSGSLTNETRFCRSLTQGKFCVSSNDSGIKAYLRREWRPFPSWQSTFLILIILLLPSFMIFPLPWYPFWFQHTHTQTHLNSGSLYERSRFCTWFWVWLISPNITTFTSVYFLANMHDCIILSLWLTKIPLCIRSNFSLSIPMLMGI